MSRICYSVVRYGTSLLLVDSPSTCYQNGHGAPFLGRPARCHFDYVFILTAVFVGTVLLKTLENL